MLLDMQDVRVALGCCLGKWAERIVCRTARRFIRKEVRPVQDGDFGERQKQRRPEESSINRGIYLPLSSGR